MFAAGRRPKGATDDVRKIFYAPLLPETEEKMDFQSISNFLVQRLRRTKDRARRRVFAAAAPRTHSRNCFQDNTLPERGKRGGQTHPPPVSYQKTTMY